MLLVFWLDHMLTILRVHNIYSMHKNFELLTYTKQTNYPIYSKHVKPSLSVCSQLKFDIHLFHVQCMVLCACWPVCKQLCDSGRCMWFASKLQLCHSYVRLCSNGRNELVSIFFNIFYFCLQNLCTGNSWLSLASSVLLCWCLLT